ncbi:hypothetical protein B0H16DRAFT_1550400 [Mycena metata]|uniref:VWFA domain-containing protein n=1 Tax=Mycena metata TaxID=1033252 RepID=A0AAD7IWW8_9AGAR|nr:hypothetical protein B0H16DRAFT_1550400 [Mycena metata]
MSHKSGLSVSGQSTAAPSKGPPSGSGAPIPQDVKSVRGNAPGLPADNQLARKHTNAVIKAALIRSRDEQEMQNLLQAAQYACGIYNSDIEPEHEAEMCYCQACNYRRAKQRRLWTHDRWSTAVRYPGEKNYNDLYGGNKNDSVYGPPWTTNPYQLEVISPYGPKYLRPIGNYLYRPKPIASFHMEAIHQTIELNRRLNGLAQRTIDALEPKTCIWEVPEASAFPSSTDGDRKDKTTLIPVDRKPSEAQNSPKDLKLKRKNNNNFLSKLRRMFSAKAQFEYFLANLAKSILDEEAGRWPDQMTRDIVANYQAKAGMVNKIKHLRYAQPIQYLHLLRAGYFEPIPVAWADQASNPLKFSIEAAGGWRGITPSWRGFEDTAEERLYWVLNHREGTAGVRMKPDFISEMTMARERMASAVEPPPEYFSPDDQCHVQHKSDGYSKQVMPKPFHASDLPETANDDTMILLDVSGSMNFDPLRTVYINYLITGFAPSTQPRNKDVAKAIVRRFTDAMAHHDHISSGYDLITFSSRANFVGTVNHKNFQQVWGKVKIGGGTRVMTGWQLVKQRHFEKHRESAIWHPEFGWQAGPETPILRLLLLLDGEATDMDEFELDLLGLSWAHVTIFLIGVDGCPHHHRHANELQRISDVNPHVSFVDAQGNTPERFVTHELLKRHLGLDLSLSQFKEMEELPVYSR